MGGKEEYCESREKKTRDCRQEFWCGLNTMHGHTYINTCIFIHTCARREGDGEMGREGQKREWEGEGGRKMQREEEVRMKEWRS